MSISNSIHVNVGFQMDLRCVSMNLFLQMVSLKSFYIVTSAVIETSIIESSC